MGTIAEIWVYPVKACGGVRVPSARVGKTGLALDRAFCIVDTEGTVVFVGEAISQRKLPNLATINCALSTDQSELTLAAPGMHAITVPTAIEAYTKAPEMQVHASGASTTTGGGWKLGSLTCHVHEKASAWLTEYLNRDNTDDPGRRMSGKSKASKFALARAPPDGLAMSSYEPVFPLIEKALADPAYTARFAGNAKLFSDFAPFLLTNARSAEATAKLAGVRSFPINARSNLVVEARRGAWAEEKWASIAVAPKGGGPPLALTKIKECPRCTVPCRDGATGGWAFPEHRLKLWDVLKKTFPGKWADPEWGSWAGVYYGVYFGHAGIEGATLAEGDEIVVLKETRWDAHLPRRYPALLFVLSAVVALALLAVAALALYRMAPMA